MKTKFNPPILVLAVIVCMAGVFLITNPLQLLVAVASWLALCWCLRVKPICCIKRAWPLCLFYLLITALNLFTNHQGELLLQLGCFQIYTDGLNTFLLFGSRLCLLVLYGAALLEGLSASLTARSVKTLLSPLAYFNIPLDALADVLVLSLHFVPFLAQEYAALREAQLIRGSMLVKKSFQPAHAVMQEASRLVALIVEMLRHAQNLSLALDSRAYVAGEKRTQLYPFKMRLRDILVGVGVGVSIVIIVVL